MRRIFPIPFIIAFVLLFRPSPISAHPLDITYMDVNVFHDTNNKPLQPNTATAAIYIPWLEASLLIEKYENKKIASPEAKLLTSYQIPYSRYIEEHVIFENEGEVCTPLYGLIPEIPQNEIIFGRGVMVPVQYTCKKPLDVIVITNSMFVTEFPLQKNIISVFNGPETSLQGAMLSSQIRDFEFDTKRLIQKVAEKKTQLPKNTALEKISGQFLDFKKHSLWYTLGIVFLLGLLHTLEAGHSKTVLTSFLIHKKATIRQGFAFVGVFTVTHLADIIILGLILLLTNSFIDVFSRLSYLQTFSLYTLLFISVYMLFKNIGHFIKHTYGIKHHDDHGHSHDSGEDIFDFKKQLIIGFIAGLSPCLFGWSIFMVVLSTKNVFSIFPIILSFGLGIASALILVVLLVGKLKVRVFDRFRLVADLSPIISSLMLVIFALISLM